jgi:hypothetical protein
MRRHTLGLLRWGYLAGNTFFALMERSLSDEYLVRCLTPSRSGVIKSLRSGPAGIPLGLPTIFSMHMNSSDPRAVDAMAKYASKKKMSFDMRKPVSSSGELKSEASAESGVLGDAGHVQIRSKKSAKLLATAIYYAANSTAGDLTLADVEKAVQTEANSHLLMLEERES